MEGLLSGKDQNEMIWRVGLLGFRLIAQAKENFKSLVLDSGLCRKNIDMKGKR